MPQKNLLNTKQNKIAFDTVISLVEPNAAPLLQSLEPTVEQIAATAYGWTEAKNFNTKSGVTAAYTAGDTNLVVRDAKVFEVEQIVSNGAEKMLVTAVNYTTSTVTVSRGYLGTTAGAIKAEATLYVVGNKSVEGSDARTARHTEENNKQNYTQIFKQSVEISGSQLTRELENAMIGIELNGTPEDRTIRKAEIQGEILAREELKKLNVMAGEMENALIFGKAYMNGTERYAGGLYDFITTNITDGGVFSSDLLDDALDNLNELGAFEDPFAKYVIYVSPSIYRAMKNMQDSTVQTLDNERLAALRPLSISTTQGTFPVVSHRRLPAGDVLVVNTTDIKLKAFRPIFQNDWLDNGTDSYKTQFIGEYTFEIKNEEKMALLKGLTVAK